MFKTNIQLSTVERVKDFVGSISDFDFVVDLASGRYCVNGKSIMGIFSLDLSKPIELSAEVPEDEREAFAQVIKPFEI